MNKVERINLDDYTQTGEGGTSLTYTSKDGKRLAKLYNPGYEADLAKEDFLTACTATCRLATSSPTESVHFGSTLAVSDMECQSGTWLSHGE